MPRVLVIPITGNGESDAFDLSVGQSRKHFYTLGILADVFGTLVGALEFSFDKTLWGVVKDQFAAVTFTKEGAVVVPAGLYYRVIVTNFSSATNPRILARIT